MQVYDFSESALKVSFDGRLDVSGVDAVESDFEAKVVPQGKHLIIDLSNVSFVASLGIRMLVSVARTLLRADAKVVLTNANGPVAEVFEMAALDELIPVVEDDKAASAKLSG